MRIAICDQTPEATDLVAFTEKYAEKKEIQCAAESFSTGEELLERQDDFDAYFIHVAFDGAGVGLAEKIREKNSSKPIVFIAGTDNFSVAGKTVDAVDMIVPPVGYYAYSTMLDRVQMRLVKTDVPPTVAVMAKKGARRVSVDEITYIENSGLDVIYHTTDGDLKAHGSLNDAAKKVTGDRFFRMGKYLINLGHVQKVSGTDLYVGAACLPLPYNKKAELLNNLLAFMNRG